MDLQEILLRQLPSECGKFLFIAVNPLLVKIAFTWNSPDIAPVDDSNDSVPVAGDLR